MRVLNEDGILLYQGDVLAVLETLPAESVDCVVTSPPYWSLRKYTGDAPAWAPEGYGLEPTPELYVEHTVTVLRAIRRVLNPTGVVFWNIGDGYQGGARGEYQKSRTTNVGTISGAAPHTDVIGAPHRLPQHGLKPKDMIAMPWRVGLAAQADGWWLRADIIWAKPNPMPESVTDRPTKSHEYVLLLTKSERYYWNQDAVREGATFSTPERQARAALDHKSMPTGERNGIRPKQDGHGRRHEGFNERWDAAEPNMPLTRNIRSVWTIPTQPSPLPHFAAFPDALAELCIKAGTPPDGVVLDPFAGTGTTLKVARDLGRKAIGIEISAEYCELAVQRLHYGIKGVMAIQNGQGVLDA